LRKIFGVEGGEDDGENCIMGSFMICSSHQMLLEYDRPRHVPGNSNPIGTKLFFLEEMHN
jgi:hypothetical protein